MWPPKADSLQIEPELTAFVKTAPPHAGFSGGYENKPIWRTPAVVNEATRTPMSRTGSGGSARCKQNLAAALMTRASSVGCASDVWRPMIRRSESLIFTATVEARKDRCCN